MTATSSFLFKLFGFLLIWTKQTLHSMHWKKTLTTDTDVLLINFYLLLGLYRFVSTSLHFFLHLQIIRNFLKMGACMLPHEILFDQIYNVEKLWVLKYNYCIFTLWILYMIVIKHLYLIYITCKYKRHSIYITCKYMTERDIVRSHLPVCTRL